MTPVERITPFSKCDSEFDHAFAWYGLQTIPAAYANSVSISPALVSGRVFKD